MLAERTFTRVLLAIAGTVGLESNRFKLNRLRSIFSWWSMILSETGFHFRIMLWCE
jgi:hypothetical protein